MKKLLAREELALGTSLFSSIKNAMIPLLDPAIFAYLKDHQAQIVSKRRRPAVQKRIMEEQQRQGPKGKKGRHNAAASASISALAVSASSNGDEKMMEPSEQVSSSTAAENAGVDQSSITNVEASSSSTSVFMDN